MRGYLPACDCAIDFSTAEWETVCHPVLQRMIKGGLFLHASALILTKHHPCRIIYDIKADSLERHANNIYLQNRVAAPANVSRIISLMSFNQLLVVHTLTLSLINANEFHLSQRCHKINSLSTVKGHPC